jgi:orotate phosphoribosyltransferase
MTREEILKIFSVSEAFLEGHFQLTSGLHSPHYFQCAKVLQYPAYAEKLCSEIVSRFHAAGITAVIAPALGGIVVGQEVGRQLNVRTMFAERKERLMQLRRGFVVGNGEKVLVCEDVITTGGSVKEVIDIVRHHGGIIAGIGAIVDRSGGNSGLPDLFATLSMEVITYKPADCPLCRAGVAVDKPGSRPGPGHAGR